MIPVRIQHPEEAQPENSYFGDSISIPISDHRHIAGNAAEWKGVILPRPGSVKGSITICIENPVKAQPHQADLAGPRAGPVSDHRDVARNSTEGVESVYGWSLIYAVAVVVEKPLETSPEYADLAPAIAIPIANDRDVCR